MSKKPYVVCPNAARPFREARLATVVLKSFIDEPGQVSFGTIDYIPGWFIPIHRHHTWELIILDGSSDGPGYLFFDNHWWRVEPGSGVFIPRQYPHSWSSGNQKGFKMLWIYGGSLEEAGRIQDQEAISFQAITPEEEKSASVWTLEMTLRRRVR